MNSTAVGLDHHSRFICQGSFYQSHNIVERIAVKQVDTHAGTHTQTHYLQECLKLYCTYCGRDFFRNVDNKHVKSFEVFETRF